MPTKPTTQGETADDVRRATRILPEAIQEEFVVVPTDLARWHSVVVLASDALKRAELDLETWEAEAADDVRVQAEKSGGKAPGVDVLKDKVRRKPRYRALVEAVIEASRVKRRARRRRRDRTKRDMLVSLGAHQRAEMGPKINEEPARRRRGRRTANPNPRTKTMTTTDATKPATEWEETDVDATTGAHDEWEKEKSKRWAKRPPKGRSVWRFLPPMKGLGGNPFFQVWVHYVRDVSDRNQIVAQGQCPSKMSNLPCVVCAESGRLRRLGGKENEDRAADLRAEFHVYANAVNLEDKEPKVLVMDMPQTVYTKLNTILKDKTAGGDFTNPDKGFNVVIIRKGEGRNDTEYDAIPARASSPITKREWLGQAQRPQGGRRRARHGARRRRRSGAARCPRARATRGGSRVRGASRGACRPRTSRRSRRSARWATSGTR